MRIPVIISLFLFLFAGSLISQDKTVKELNDGWKFRRLSDTAWYSAKVPGTLHTDMLANDLIQDPFLYDNANSLQWIENESTEYMLEFMITKEMTERHTELVFEGLDTYADVFLNGKNILNAENMFRRYRIPVNKYLRSGINKIQIIFYSPVKVSDSLQAKYYEDYEIKGLPGKYNAFTRKASYHFGWDWAPRLITSGIWRNVYLMSYDGFISDAIFQTESISENSARININCIFELSPTAETKGLSFVLSDSSGENIFEMIPYYSKYTNKKSNLLIHKTFNFEIENPKLWQMLQEGKQNFYYYKIQIRKDEKILDEKLIKAGIRDVKLIQEKDSIGESFYFTLNGKPVFIKGANYVPQDVFLPRVSREQYRKLLVNAKDAGINMLRVWGGGIYEDDYFYKLCDSLGILVWQDFMFANSMFPGEGNFFKNISAEIEDNYRRLINHPCIALWCGNNEIEEGWHNWGWQKEFEYSKEDSAKIWNDYYNIFYKLIPAKLGSIGVFGNLKYNYIPTSPKYGWGRPKSMTTGDAHYWGVWWGMEKFEMYEKKVPRFMSEYGFQSFPDYSTVMNFINPTERFLYSEELKSHQKHPVGFETIQKYLEREYRQPKNFESYIFVSQLLQANGIQLAIEAHRRAMPYCMGTMFWQLNDCWHSVSWSAIDYTGKNKVLMSYLKNAYDEILLSFENRDSSAGLFVISDLPQSIGGKLFLSVRNFSGEYFFRDSVSVLVEENSSKEYFRFNTDSIFKNLDRKEYFLEAKFLNSESGDIFLTKRFYFAKPKEMDLKNPGITYIFEPLSESAGRVTFRSEYFAKDVFVDFGTFDNDLGTPNYFDIVPGDSVSFVIEGNAFFNANNRILKIFSLFDTF